MQVFRRALLAVVAVLASTVPALAQSTGTVNPGNFIYIWVVILIVGIILFVAMTSIAVSGKK